MMRPEQTKKFCSCSCFLFGGNIKTISNIFCCIFFSLLCRPIEFLVETSHALSALQGYAAILSFAQLSIIASPLFLCFPFFHLISFHSQDKKGRTERPNIDTISNFSVWVTSSSDKRKKDRIGGDLCHFWVVCHVNLFHLYIHWDR